MKFAPFSLARRLLLCAGALCLTASSLAAAPLKVAYSENIDRVMGTMREAGASMEKDPVWSGVILAPLEIVGVESLEGGVATLRAKFKTLPLHQGRVANELRRRLMGMFVGRGIRPYSNT